MPSALRQAAGEGLPASQPTIVVIWPEDWRLWSASYDGQPLVTRVRDPEHQACRALKALGVAGRVIFVHRGGIAGLSMDIDRDAGLSAVEHDDRSIHVRKFVEFPVSVRPPARVSPSAGTPTPPATNASLRPAPHTQGIRL